MKISSGLIGGLTLVAMLICASVDGMEPGTLFCLLMGGLFILINEGMTA